MKSLPKEEQAILNVKYAAKRFGAMDADEATLTAHEMLLKIHTITGWVLPTDTYLKILTDQLTKKLQESYSNLNVEEVEYAFRNRGIDLKDWGREINLTIIDEVLIPYLDSRVELSKLEEQIKKPIMIEDVKPLTKEDKAEWMMEWKEKVDTINFELIPLIFYDFMEDDNLLRLTSKQKYGYLDRATVAVKSQLQIDIGNCKTTDALRIYGEFEKMEKEGFIGELKGRVLNKAKRLIIYDYLKGVIK